MKIVQVPQKCYGIITPETDPDIIGLYTEGLHTCGTIIVIAKDEKGNYLFLCHADDGTHLEDSTQGIPSWLSIIPESYTQITISCEESQFEIYRTLFNTLTTSDPTRYNIQKIANPTVGASVDRQGKIDFGLNLIESIEQCQGEILSSDIEQCLELIAARHCAPICIFNGKDILPMSKILQERSDIAEILSSTSDYESSSSEGIERRLKNLQFL